MVCAQCPDRWPVTSQSNTIRTQFPNLISAMSHNKLPHSEKWEWMVMRGGVGVGLGGCEGDEREPAGKERIENKVGMMVYQVE